MPSPQLISTTDFARRHFEHLTQHPPDSLIFPFLHGIEGNNQAQNNFFVSPYPPQALPRPPNFTGLLWVVAEEDLDREHKNSLYSGQTDEDDELLDDDEEDDEIEDLRTPSMDVDLVHVVGEGHMHPVAHRSPGVDYGQLKDMGKPSHTNDKRASRPCSDTSMLTDTRPSSPLPTSPVTPPKQQLEFPPLLTSSFRPSEIIQQSHTGEWEFIPLAVPEGISLRNFGIQVPIYATLSDIVVYSPKGPTPAVWELGRRIQGAILKKRQERLHKYADCPGTLDDEPWMNYQVLILDANEKQMRQELPHLMVSLLPADAAHTHWQNGETGNEVRKTNGHASIDIPNTISFARREKDEMRELTRASEIISLSPPGVISDNPNTDPRVGQVYLGHLEDVPLVPELPITPSPITSLPPEHPESPFNPSQTNPSHFDICVECHELAPFPTVSQLKVAEEHLATLERKWMEHCSDAGLPVDTPRPAPHASAVLHIPFPSSPPSTAGTMALLVPLLRFFEKWVRPVTQSSSLASGESYTSNGQSSSRRWSTVSGLFPSFSTPSPRSPSSPFRARSQTTPLPLPSQTPPRTRPLKILLYSADGYTESSVPALCLLMVIRGLKLPEAYLELQVEKHRSFFVYTGDLSLLKRVEARIIKHPESHEVNGTNITKTPVAPYQEPPYLQGRPMGRPSAKSISYAHAPGLVPVLPASSPPPSSMRPPESSSHPRNRPRANTSPWLPSFRDHLSWFNDPRFDGSFPSRVLPFLYLGNLNHASNVYMLHALGITHVVSVGECALVPPPHLQNETYDQADGSVLRSQLVQGKEGSLWIEEREGRIKVLDIKGVCDDGIDTLEPQLGPICDWIDKAREEGGKVLVHCRVGVSRSATVTIAYVMKHLRIPLSDAYLIVRSRRLSVLIQPNMRLLYNLLGWEIKLAKERANGDPARLKNELSGALTWPYLAKEVHALNEKYLH